MVSSAVLQPFQAAVNALLYVDQRIRKEAYDVELLGRAGILPRLMLAPAPPLDPSGDEGRRLLRAELLHREYHQQDLWQRLVAWLSRALRPQRRRGVRRRRASRCSSPC